MIDFTKYKENLSVDAFVSIVSRDIINNLDDDTRENFKNIYLLGRYIFLMAYILEIGIFILT